MRVGELGERLAVDIRRVVLLRVDLEVARQLLLLLLARQFGLRDDALSGSHRQRVAEQDGGFRQGLAGESGQCGFPVPDRILGHVDDHHVRRAVQEQAVPVGADVGAGLVQRVIVERQVRDHPAARVDLLHQVARRVIHRVVDVDGVVEQEFGQSVLVQVQAGQVGLAFRDENVGAGGVLGGQFVRSAVAGPHERQAVPVQPVGRGAVLGVRAPPVPDGDAVAVVAEAVLVFPVELVDLDLVAVPDRAGIEGLKVPLQHLLHPGDHALGAQLRRAPRGPVTRSGCFHRPPHAENGSR